MSGCMAAIRRSSVHAAERLFGLSASAPIDTQILSRKPVRDARLRPEEAVHDVGVLRMATLLEYVVVSVTFRLACPRVALQDEHIGTGNRKDAVDVPRCILTPASHHRHGVEGSEHSRKAEPARQRNLGGIQSGGVTIRPNCCWVSGTRFTEATLAGGDADSVQFCTFETGRKLFSRGRTPAPSSRRRGDRGNRPRPSRCTPALLFGICSMQPATRPTSAIHHMRHLLSACLTTSATVSLPIPRRLQ